MADSSSKRTSRRQFLRRSTATLSGAAWLASPRSAFAYASNERLGIALVGIGGRGRSFVDSVPGTGERVVAVCDVNDQRAAESYEKLPTVPRFKDFRLMLDQREKDIDAVVIATPDNVHAVISMHAMRRRKHVYCEKPLTHDVLEARELTKAARRYGVATQMGNQGTASPGFRKAYALVRSGVLGEVREVHAWRDGGGSGKRPLPQGEHDVPPFLEWDLWLGPAAARPFHPQWLRWHGWRDFGTGNLGNWGCHAMNLAFHALGIVDLWKSPTASSAEASSPVITVSAESSEIDAASFPRSAAIRYAVPARGELPPVAVTWYNGLARLKDKRAEVESKLGRPLDFGDHGERKWYDHAGCLLIGSKGRMHLIAHNTTFTLLPEDRFSGVETPPGFALRSPGHLQEWIRACKGGEVAWSNFDASGPLAEFVLLGNAATRLDRPLRFDIAAVAAAGDEEGSRTLRRDYRDGWSLEW